MNSKMHQFTIDYITREATHGTVGMEGGLPFEMCKSEREGYLSRQVSRQTPSPSDSGMESDNSPGKCERKKNNEDENAIADVLLSLEKNAAKCHPSTADDTSEEKPTHSYIALISMAILSSSEKKMLLCDIYQYIKENFDYYNNEEKAWRNSIRHNLSLNECFIKAGRADNGKGNFWAIHPACIEDFAKGDFRRRQARRRARKCQKETPYSDMRTSCGYNVGYVPMTASHIAYHPYGGATSQLYYPQHSTLTSMSQQSSPTYSPPLSTSASHTQSSSRYHGACSEDSISNSSSTSSSTISAAAQRFLAEQANSTMYTMQALAQQQLAASLQFPNW